MNRILMSTLLSLSMGVASAQTQNVEVVELHPAPGQFVNTMPQAEEEPPMRRFARRLPMP